MPDFTVVEGGGNGSRPDLRDKYRANARRAFRRLVVEMLRALARGSDSEDRVMSAMKEFITNASDGELQTSTIVEEAIGMLSTAAFEADEDDDPSKERKAILETGLRVIVESLAEDPAAAGREQKRIRDFRRAVDEYVVAREARTRANGWSYTQKLTTDHLGRWSPPPRSGAAPAQKPRGPRSK